MQINPPSTKQPLAWWMASTWKKSKSLPKPSKCGDWASVWRRRKLAKLSALPRALRILSLRYAGVFFLGFYCCPGPCLFPVCDFRYVCSKSSLTFGTIILFYYSCLLIVNDICKQIHMDVFRIYNHIILTKKFSL